MKINKYLKPLSIRARIIIIFVSLISITLTVVGIIIFSSWIDSAHESSLALSKKTNDEIASQVEGFLDNPLELNQAHANLVTNDYINMLDEVERERFFVLSLKNYDEQVYSFSYGTINGEYYGARRNEDNVIEIMRNNADTGGYSWYYSVDEDLVAVERVVIAGLFDPRIRPWYTEAVDSGATVFSPIYSHFIMEDLAVSLSTPIYDDLGVLQGVLGTHMILSNINDFLSDTLDESNGKGIIIDINSNELIANSIGVDNYTLLEDNSVHRTTVEELSDQNFDKAYQYYTDNNLVNFELKNDKKTNYYSISEIHEEGIDWLIITSVPRGVLFDSILNNIILMVTIFVFSIMMMIIVYHLFITNVFKPIDDLVEVSENYSVGNFSKKANVSGSNEFGKLAEAFNAMAFNISNMVNGLEQIVLDRTENLRIVNKTLKESEQRFKILHNASFGGIAVHDKGFILDCNQGLADITGFSMDELIGMDGLLLIAPNYRDFVMNKIVNGYEKPYEAFGIRKNKEIYPLKLEARNIPYNGKQVRVVEFRDITELKKQESEKKASEEKYHLLYETMIQGVVYQDYEGYITSCNPAA